MGRCLSSGILLIGLFVCPPAGVRADEPKEPVGAPSGGIGVAAFGTALAATTQTPAPSADAIRRWIAALSSDRFETREEATRQLEQAGEGAIASLHRAAEGTSLEVTCRAIRALEGIAERGDTATFESAQSALEQLAESRSRSVARRASFALSSLGTLRRDHALARIVELGGILKPIKGFAMTDDDDFMGQIVLNSRWKGGDAGLIHIRRLGKFEDLFITKSANVSDKAVQELTQALPERRIHQRGNAMLGIRSLQRPEMSRCQISEVTPDSAAAAAGLEQGDVILKYDGEDIQDFMQLIKLTNSREIGDRIELEINRNGKVLRKELVLREFQ